MPGDLIAGRYELEELVGAGGMSSVYRAHDQLLERHVALKVLHSHYAEDEEYVERFRREARSVAQLSHPHIGSGASLPEAHRLPESFGPGVTLHHPKPQPGCAI